MKEKLNETIKEVEVQNEKYRENQKLLLEARDDILKLEEANALLKDQVCLKLLMFVLLTSALRLFLNGWTLQSQILIQCFR